MGLRDELRRSAGGLVLELLALGIPYLVRAINRRLDEAEERDKQQQAREEAEAKKQALEEAKRQAEERRKMIEAERTASRIKAQKAKQEVHNANSNYQGPRKP